MVGPRPAVTQPTPAEFTRLTNGPQVKIFVGDRVEPYVLSKDLLAWYSPYFHACFNGNFKEGIEGVLRLPEDKPAHFELLIEYIRTGSATYPEQAKCLTEAAMVDICFNFVLFADKYDMNELASVIAKPYEDALNSHSCCLDLEDPPFTTPVDQFSFIFSSLHEADPTHKVVARFLAKTLCWPGIADRRPVETLLREDKVAAAHVMKAFIKLTFQNDKSCRTLKKDDRDLASYQEESHESEDEETDDEESEDDEPEEDREEENMS